MRGEAHPQTALFSYISLEKRVPRNHPLRKMRVFVDAILANMDGELAEVYSNRGRPSIPPEFLLRASLLQILYAIRSERPYRSGRTHAEAVTELRRCSGAQFDPAVVSAFDRTMYWLALTRWTQVNRPSQITRAWVSIKPNRNLRLRLKKI